MCIEVVTRVFLVNIGCEPKNWSLVLILISLETRLIAVHLMVFLYHILSEQASLIGTLENLLIYQTQCMKLTGGKYMEKLDFS